MRDEITQSVQEGIRALKQLLTPQALSFIESSVLEIVDSFRRGGKLIVAGNGGSLCDAMHFAEELTGFFRDKRPALPAIALADPGHMSCVANDLGFDDVFSRGVEAYGKKEDILIVFTTSGNSPNIVNAVAKAQEREMKTIAFLGKTGGKLKGVADFELVIEEFNSSDHIQEAHKCAMHIIIDRVECILFAPKESTSLVCETS